MHERVTVLSLCVSRSVAQLKADLKDDGLHLRLFLFVCLLLLGNPLQAEVTIKRTWMEDTSYWVKKLLFTLFLMFCFVSAINYSSLNSVKGACELWLWSAYLGLCVTA